MTDIEFSNPRSFVDSKATIGTLQFSATVEKKADAVARIANGNIMENGTHIGNFGLEENGNLFSNIFRATGVDLATVYTSLIAYVTGVETYNPEV